MSRIPRMRMHRLAYAALGSAQMRILWMASACASWTAQEYGARFSLELDYFNG
jgi:hypothetical protein